MQTLPLWTKRNAGGRSLQYILDCCRDVHALVNRARSMRPRLGPAMRGRSREGPLHAVRAQPLGIPETQGISPLPSHGIRQLWAPGRPFLALVLLVSIKQVRADFYSLFLLLILSVTYFGLRNNLGPTVGSS